MLRMNVRISVWISICTLGVSTVIGCGRGTDRIAVKGSVAVDGKPLESGSIRFVPDAGVQGPTAGGSIAAGRFEIPATDGPLAGIHRVEITASRPTGDHVPDDATGNLAPVHRQYLPPRFNDETTIRADIQPGTPPLEFSIESR
jgi:hypothetical protein